MDYNFDVADKTLFVTRGANMLHVASIRVSSPLAKAINSLRQRIATLEAEKAGRERQKPVATVCVKRTGFNAGIEWGAIRDGVMMNDGDPLYAHPLALREPTDDECREIADRFLCEVANAARGVRTGRAMFNAVREVLK